MDLEDEYQNPPSQKQYDPYTSPTLAINAPKLHDILDQIFSSNEAILEVVNVSKPPCDDMHHRSSLLPARESLEVRPKKLKPNDHMKCYQCTIETQDVFTEENLKNISKIIPINIYIML